MKLRCPTCSNLLHVPDDSVGEVMSCPQCHAKVKVPPRPAETDTQPAEPETPSTEPQEQPVESTTPAEAAPEEPPAAGPLGLDAMAIRANESAVKHRHSRRLTAIYLLAVIGVLVVLVVLNISRRWHGPQVPDGPAAVALIGNIDAALIDATFMGTVVVVTQSADVDAVYADLAEHYKPITIYNEGKAKPDTPKAALDDMAGQAAEAATALEADLAKLNAIIDHYPPDDPNKRRKAAVVNQQGKFDFGSVRPGAYYVFYDMEQGLTRRVWLFRLDVAGDRAEPIRLSAESGKVFAWEKP